LTGLVPVIGDKIVSDQSQKPKIVVDDDWKAQVEAEKKAFEQHVEQEGSQGKANKYALPEATFMTLISSLATQSLVALGQIADPFSGEASINKPLAKHSIDMLAMLEEKTNRNLNVDEKRALTEVLHELRMAYVNTPDKMPETKTEEKKSSTIELP
jgi:hypothetical protein